MKISLSVQALHAFIVFTSLFFQVSTLHAQLIEGDFQTHEAILQDRFNQYERWLLNSPLSQELAIRELTVSSNRIDAYFHFSTVNAHVALTRWQALQKQYQREKGYSAADALFFNFLHKIQVAIQKVHLHIYDYHNQQEPCLVVQMGWDNSASTLMVHQQQCSSANNQHRTKKTGENVIIAEPVEKPKGIIVIEDAKTGQRDAYTEAFMAQVLSDSGLRHLEMKGSFSIILEKNSSIRNQYRASLSLKLTLAGESLAIPLLYGRGENEQEVLRHVLSFNRKIIINQIKSE